MSASAHDWRSIEREHALKLALEESQKIGREDFGFKCDCCHVKPAVVPLDKEFLCDECHALRWRQLNLELTR